MNAEKNIISVAPVKKYAPPKYPTQADVKRSPELLRRLPSRWEKNAAVVAAVGILGVMTLTSASCGILNLPTNGNGNPVSDSSAYSAYLEQSSENAKIPREFLNVAPVFVHGEGTGSMGCMMIAPPVFLSEEEALAIIKGEAESCGLNFTAEPPNYVATSNKTNPPSYSDETREYAIGNGNVGLKFYDSEKEVAVAYISMRSAGIATGSSVATYLPRELAELTVKDFAQQKGDISIGVFYDPGMNYGDSWDDENVDKTPLEENLRAQVRDFIGWLRGQGILTEEDWGMLYGEPAVPVFTTEQNYITTEK